ncbi:histidine kinase [Paenibacillus sp. MSJ-6]|uniref:Histidine kinase n=2 Tax=Paenibacillus brevis TaxID=2841508 RepID=A0ABS6FU53_9BACL|nr:histidine kinase [Paenibacillus brevis]
MVKRLMDRFHFSLQTRVFLTLVILLLFVLGCFMIYVNQMVISPLKERTLEEKIETVAGISGQIDFYIDSQNQLSQRILSSKDVFAILEKRNQSVPLVERLQQNRKLLDIMFQAIGPRTNIKDMTIYDLEGRPLLSYIGMGTNPQMLQLPLVDGRSDTAWNGVGFLLRHQDSDLSFIRAISNQNGRVYGYLSIQLDESYIERITEGAALGAVHVLDGSGNRISGNSDHEHIELTTVADGQGVYVDPYKNYIAYYQSPGTGWTAYLVTPKQDVTGPINSIIKVSVLLITLLMLVSFVYIYLSTRNLLLPIRRLRSQIWRLSYSNMNIKQDYSRRQNNELILLNEAFQDLMNRLQESIEREKAALHEEVKARNSALQAQIAPHFIHNVLYLISIAAQEGKSHLVSDMCKHLSDSLRYIVSSPYAHVTLAEELEHTRHYLSLVQQKYEEDLVWEIHADALSHSIQLPRLTIQPFVENCIEHAFLEKSPPWRIKITVKQFNGLWVLEIKDNGSGFHPDKIKQIKDSLGITDSGILEGRNDHVSIGNMGIINSVHRLKLMYQNRLFFNIFNHADGEEGATVQIIGSLTREFY